MKQEVFRIIYNFSNHKKFYRVYNRLINLVYVRYLTKRLRIYIKHCSKCQLNQIKRHFFYDFLQLINILLISFYTLIINFILTLSIINNINVTFTTTCICNKKTLTISSKNIWNVKNWTNAFITTLITRD